MAFDEHGNPVEEEASVPQIVDKLAPIQAMRNRRMKFDLLSLSATSGISAREERRILIDALEYVEVFSEDAFARLMARHALGVRPR